MPRPTSSARPLRPSEEENSLFAGHEHLGTSGPPMGNARAFFARTAARARRPAHCACSLRGPAPDGTGGWLIAGVATSV